MKKLIMSLLLLAVPLFAVQQTDCERNPHECYEPIPGPVGPQGEQGIPGVDGIDGIDGKDGKDGKTGRPGKDGVDGVDGIDGATGEDGATGLSGTDGKDGKTVAGPTGKTGAKGDTGPAGKDADQTAIAQLQSDRKKQNSFATDSAAGNSAMVSMDFGSIKEGETHGGLGIGVSKSWYGSSTAGAIGVKHGFTDETAGVIKVWSAGSNSYGGGAGVVHKF